MSKLSELKGMIKLKKLNISNTSIATLQDSENFPLLEELIITPGQFSSQQIERLPESVKLVFVEE